MEQTPAAERMPQNRVGMIDFSNPRMQPMIRMLQANIRAAAQAWQPESGVQRHWKAFSTKEGVSVPCAVLETENAQASCLFCHGGGMIFPLQAAALCIAEYLAREAQISVWVPDYHLPPDAPYPQPVDECFCVWREMVREPGPAILYGESVGGTLAASLALRLRDEKAGQPDLLMLIDPAVDCDTECYPSAALDSQAAWTLKNNRYMWARYLPEGQMSSDPEAIPIRADAAGFPPTYLETAELDILRDEGEAFGRKLMAAGAAVELRRMAGVRHGFDTERNLPETQKALRTRAEWIRDNLKSLHQEADAT